MFLLKKEMDKEVAANKRFWRVTKKSLRKVDKKVFTCVRNVKTNGGRKALSCPMPFCLAQVHNVSTTEKQQAVFARGTGRNKDSKPWQKTKVLLIVPKSIEQGGLLLSPLP